jgi:uncharacterized protein YhaN
MRIEKINLIAYGPFAGETLDFAELDRDFHMIYGPNEAGKSSLLRALTAALFGIPERTDDNFRHQNDQLKIGMTLQRKDGALLAFQRKKRRQKSLCDEEDFPLEESALAAFLGTLEESHFCNTFGLNHQRLIEGGRDIIAGGGEIGQSLFEAGSGMVGLPKMLLSLEESAGKIFLPQGRTKPSLNQGIDRYDTAKKEMKALSLKSNEWSDLQTGFETVTAALQKKGIELQEIRKALSQLERIQRNLPALARRASLLGTQAALAAIPDLPENAGSERIKASQIVHATEEEVEEIEKKIQTLTDESSAIGVRSDLFGHSGRIDDLYKNVGSFRNTAGDIPKREAERAMALSRAADALKGIRPDLPLEQAETLRLTLPQTIEIRRLARKHTELLPQRQNSRDQADEVSVKIDQLRDAMARAPKRVDISRLAAAIATVKAQGDLESRLREARQEIATEKSHIETELSALPLWQGGVELLEKLPFPFEETVDHFKALFEQLEKEALIAQGQAGQEERKYQERIAELDRLQAGGEVPTPAQLQESRARRALGWRLIREAFIERTQTADEAALHFDPSLPLPDSYERSVAAADRIADLLHEDSERVAQHEGIKRELRQHEKEIGLLQEKIKALAARRREMAQEWEAHWKPAGISPLSPREMSRWLQRREHLLDRAQNLRGKEAQALLLQKTVEEARAALSPLLEAMGRPAAGEKEGVRSLLIRCEQLAGALAEANEAIDSLDEKRAEQESALKTAASRLQGAEAALAEWRIAWASAIGPIGMGAEASPAQVEGVLDSLEALFKALKEVEGFDLRLREMRQAVKDYAQRAMPIVEAVAPELREKHPDEAVEALYRLCQTAKKEAQRRENLETQIQGQRELLERTRRKGVEAKRQLSALCKQAGCSDMDDLPSIEKKSVEKQETAKRLKELEEELINRSGRSLEEIVKEASGVDRELLPQQIAGLKEEEARRQEEQLALAGKEADARSALKSLDGGDRAAAAAEQAASALAEIRSGAEAYVRLRLSSDLLRRAIETYRERNQGPLLSRAGSFFSSLTLGRFSGLKSEYDEQGHPILVGVRAGGEHVPVGGMSDGSADQLYFSLRLAAIEHFTRGSEPCPLILDDILIQFDDERARAALKILDDLSTKTQILFFTHHEHLVGLASQTLGLDAKAIHRLERRPAKASI